MSHVKDILPRNDEGSYHGYIEAYDYNGELRWKGVCVNGEPYGGFYYNGYEAYYLGGNICGSDIRDIGNADGYCYVWSKVIV